jgi:hypothetical protein
LYTDLDEYYAAFITGLAEMSDNATNNSEWEAVRAKLLAAGFLVTAIHAPESSMPLSEEELYQLDQRPPGSKTLDELINEDRG